MSTQPINMVKAVKDLNDARERYDAAFKAHRQTSLAKTDAGNALNEAQKRFDEAVEAVKKDAPCESGWGSRIGLSIPI